MPPVGGGGEGHTVPSFDPYYVPPINQDHLYLFNCLNPLGTPVYANEYEYDTDTGTQGRDEAYDTASLPLMKIIQFIKTVFTTIGLIYKAFGGLDLMHLGHEQYCLGLMHLV